MKCWIVPFVLFAVAFAHSQTKPMDSPAATTGCSVVDETALRRVSEEWKEGYNSGNAEKVAALYVEDAYYLTQHFVTGVVHPRDQIQAYVQRGVDAHYHIDTIDIFKLSCSGNLAYTVGRYESTNAGQKAMGVNIVVLRKIDGKWLIVAHESSVPDPATAVQKLEPAKLQ